VERDDRGGVEVVGEPPGPPGGVDNCEVDGHCSANLSHVWETLYLPTGQLGAPACWLRQAATVPWLMVIPVSGLNLRRRLVQLVAGLVLFGLGIAMMLQSGLGLPPWDVLHQGLATRYGLTVGIWSIIISLVVLLAWLPLRERFGIGTVLNAIIIGVVIDLGVLVIPQPHSLWWNLLLLTGGILLIGLASGMYIGANLGPGPRDGLMTAVARRGPSVRLTRWVLEIVVLVTGIILGGTFGIGTIAFALLIGPIVQFFLPRWSIDTGRPEDAWDHPAR
jgi:uncharacterized membrane protein YczE